MEVIIRGDRIRFLGFLFFFFGRKLTTMEKIVVTTEQGIYEGEVSGRRKEKGSRLRGFLMSRVDDL